MSADELQLIKERLRLAACPTCKNRTINLRAAIDFIRDDAPRLIQEIELHEAKTNHSKV